jgi:hypothetical protein
VAINKEKAAVRKEDIYFIVSTPSKGRSWVFDRFYNQLDDPENVWKTIPLTDIVEVNDGWIPPTAPDDCRVVSKTYDTCCFWTKYKKGGGW